jgi:hypothetical protein
LSPDFDELVGTEATGAERKRLREAHDLLLRAGPPPELTPKLKAGPNPGVARMQRRRRTVKRRSLVLLAAALSIGLVFAAGYAVSSHRGGSTASAGIVKTLELKGTAAVPGAQAELDVWQRRDGNWPMTLSVKGLPKLPPRTYYEVYLFRDGHPWASCGSFVVSGSSQALRVSLNAPYKLHKGDSWVVTRQVAGSEPGKTVMRPVST